MEDDDVQVIAGLGTAAEDLTANSEWLLKRLPRLPCFAGYYPQISNALRFACQYENDPLGMLGISLKFIYCEKTTKLKNVSSFFEITSKQNGLGQASFYLLEPAVNTVLCRLCYKQNAIFFFKE